MSFFDLGLVDFTKRETPRIACIETYYPLGISEVKFNFRRFPKVLWGVSGCDATSPSKTLNKRVTKEVGLERTRRSRTLVHKFLETVDWRGYRLSFYRNVSGICCCVRSRF